MSPLTNCSLKDFMDYALLCVDSLFTVGFAEEECDTVPVTEMADTPEHAHKMAATMESVHKMAATTTPLHVIAASHESIQVTDDRHESGQVTAAVSESSCVSTDLP